MIDPMLLSLLFAAIDDAVNERARRAALHEMRQRLFPTNKKLSPSVSESLLDAYLKMPWETASTRELIDIRNALFRFIMAMIGETTGWTTVDARLIPGWVQGRPEAMGHFRLIFLGKDHGRLLRAYREKTPFVPAFRTEFDPMIAFVFHVYGEAPNPFGEMKAADIQLALPSMRDWFLAMHPDLSTMTWLQAVAASSVWHSRFKMVGFGDPVPAAFVVLRFSDGWTLQRLTEKADLAREGMSMAHCVGGPPRGNGVRDGDSSYWQDIRDDRSVILSLRDPEGMPKATVEMRQEDGHVVQVQGPLDRDIDGETKRHLVHAFWAFPVFPSQKNVHRIGDGGVWSDADIHRAANQSRVFDDARNLQSIYRARTSGEMEDHEFEFEASGAETRLADSLRRAAHRITENIHSDWNHEVKPVPPPAFPKAAEYIKSIVDPTLILEVDGVPERVLSIYLFAGRAWFAVASLDGEKVDYMGQSPVAALRAYTQAPSEPPSLDGLEAFPGLPIDPAHTNWRRLLCPVKEARALRRTQLLSVPS